MNMKQLLYYTNKSNTYNTNRLPFVSDVFSASLLFLLFHIQEVIVDFEAHAISDKDFNGIKKLLQQVWDSIYV